MQDGINTTCIAYICFEFPPHGFFIVQFMIASEFVQLVPKKWLQKQEQQLGKTLLIRQPLELVHESNGKVSIMRLLKVSIRRTLSSPLRDFLGVWQHNLYLLMKKLVALFMTLATTTQTTFLLISVGVDDGVTTVLVSFRMGMSISLFL